MKTISVINGPRNEVSVQPDNTADRITVGSSAYAGVLPELTLNITRSGQTLFNVGGAEPRRTLYLNGVRQRVGLDYTISLPHITWIASVQLEPTDLLILTF